MASEASFPQFLEALRNMRRDEETVRPTAHTSSVSAADWELVQSTLTELEAGQ